MGGGFEYTLKATGEKFAALIGADHDPKLYKKGPCPRCNGTSLELSSHNRHNRQKGARNELKAVKWFTEHWRTKDGKLTTFKRTPQSGGSALAKEFDLAGDVCCDDKDFPFGIECKRDKGWELGQLLTGSESTRIFKFMEQAIGDCPNGKMPLLWLQNPGPSQPTYILIITGRTSSAGTFKSQDRTDKFKDAPVHGVTPKSFTKFSAEYALYSLDQFKTVMQNYHTQVHNG